MKEITINDIPKYIDAAPIQMSTMFIGDTGIGKTQVITEYAKNKNIHLKTLILSQLEASEALGIPVQEKIERNGKVYSTIDMAVPKWVFDFEDAHMAGKETILYLDEFLCAEPAVMNSFLNFLTEKKVNDIDLSYVKVVAATNIGNYTYEPDNNILSRFCMFYTVNTSFNTYIKNKYKGSKISIANNYKDVENREGVIFEQRSLKPRCQEMLYMLKDPTLLDAFYEGYTNTQYRPRFHSDDEINNIICGAAEKRTGTWYLSDEHINNVAGLIHRRMTEIGRAHV